MMETAKIRRAGYPIRHSYKEFVERYRYLAPGIGPAHKVDCREAAKKICANVLKTNTDYQFGNTKIFLKDSHDVLLEEERSRVYLRYILILQRGFRRVIFKRWIKKHRDAAILIQKNFRGRGYRRNFLTMRNGFRRLQAVLQSRQLAHNFTNIRKSMVLLQAQCRGYLTRKNLKSKMSAKAQKMQELLALRNREELELRKAGHKNYREIAEANYLERVANLKKEIQIKQEEPQQKITNGHQGYTEEDNKFVEYLFDFIPPTSPEPEPKHKTAVSNLLIFFEERIKFKRTVPKKLLSRPVKYYENYTYDYASRL